MRILMIGGTRFVGRHLVEAALAAGHDVTVFHRGRSGSDLFPGVPHLLGDRNDDLSALAGAQEWDATIDTCAYVPRHVHALRDALGGRGGHNVFVSSVSVYASPQPGYDEQSPLLTLDDPTTEAITNETYGGLKVLCERAAVERFGTSTLIVRPTYVVGPHDPSWRFAWWVARLAAGGDVLAPGPAGDPAQVIDARDMATWMIDLVGRGVGGVFHAVGPREPITWGQLLEAIAATVAPAGTRLVWAPEDELLAEGLDGAILPMWSGGDPDRAMSAADPSAALDAGLVLRPLVDTIADVHAWVRSVEVPPDAGLDPARERELLTRLQAG